MSQHQPASGQDPPQDTISEAALYLRAAEYVAAFRDGLSNRPVDATASADSLRQAFDPGLPDGPTRPEDVLEKLISSAEPGLVATAGPRYFGFVIGGSLPAATAAEIVGAGWDQCAFHRALSPAAIAAEEAAGTWLKDLLRLPGAASVGFVTGAQEANTVGLACGRHAVLESVGWNVERDGLHGAPRLRVVAGTERHATIDRSLRLLGLGDGNLELVAADDNGAIDVADLARVLDEGPDGPTIVCLQAGNVNTGAIDDLRGATQAAHEHGAWVHVDGAFGLWAAASPTRGHLVDGIELADSWGTDGHKWLNVPYDSGFVFCAQPDVHAAAVSYTASYLTGTGTGDVVGGDLTLQSSRRARGFATWAALQQLGRQGVADVVDRCCALAQRFAAGLSDAGLEIPNDVMLNQVLVAVSDDADRTDEVIAAIQAGGTCWLGGTTWRERRLLRISVSNATTTEADVDHSIEAILAAVAA